MGGLTYGAIEAGADGFAAPRVVTAFTSGSRLILVGPAGPLVMPPVTAVLLNSVPDHRAGIAGGGPVRRPPAPG